ncbi:hypothetical protein K1719_040544 [Acacia pycnantha]|nr:hypothetical protein K1719_040544 [Acacia pycnantha]
MALRVVALSCVVFLLSLISFASMATVDQCHYLVAIQTGDRSGAGTNSKISLKLFNSNSGDSLTVKNIEEWGIMASGHDYFERGNRDIFSRTAACVDVCAITVTSDNSGYKSGWYLDYVEVTLSGSISKKISFPANQWLALSEPPYKLSATVDLCSWRIISKSTLSSV